MQNQKLFLEDWYIWNLQPDLMKVVRTIYTKKTLLAYKCHEK